MRVPVIIEGASMSRARVLTKFIGSAAVATVVLSALVATSAPATAAAQVHDGLSAATAAASCWEIKQDNPAAADGTYWLLTSAMAAPGQFYCDMTTDGGGWVLIGKGREGWSGRYEGTGTASALQTAGLSPMSGLTTQYPAKVVDGLLNGARPDALADGIRLKRASNAAGTGWQESRFSMDKEDRWVWTFGAEHTVAWYSFDGVRGTGGLTSSFGPDNAYRRINTNTSEVKAQNYTIGFSYGTGVTGTSASTSYLWSATDGGTSPRPYTEMYLRPQISSLTAGFTRIGDAGTAATSNPPVASSLALDSPWGLAGAVSPKREGDVEAQAFVQSGNTMYVGGNFTAVQRSAASTGADKVAQSFLAAFDVNTGELVRTFTPQLDGSVMSLAVLPNGAIVAAGMFANANGAPASAIVALDPATGATATGWNLKLENRLTAGVLRVSDLAVSGKWLYLGGAFTHLTGGSNPDSTVYAKGAARVAASDGTPAADWNPEFNGTVVAIDPNTDGSRLYAVGYFTTSSTSDAFRAAAVQTAAGAPLATPVWAPVWSTTNKTYQQTVGAVGDRVWVGGSEHSLFSYSPETFERLSGNIGKNNGDFQTMTASKTGVLYAGSHGHDWNYSNAFTWPAVGTNWTEADSFEWVGAWDAVSGNIIPSFNPNMKFRLGQGIWASIVDSNGTLWAGGDMTTVATVTKAGKWSGGFARFPQNDASVPVTPGPLTSSQDTSTTIKLWWGASSDNSGKATYQILRNDRVIATTSATNLVVPKGGENRFFVRAADAAGNLSASTPVLTASGGNAAPVPVFSTSADGFKASFDATGSTDDGGIADYAWNFGDGTTGTGQTVSHVYAAAGTYNVSLTATDGSGEKAQVSHTVTFIQPAPDDGYGAAVYAQSPTLFYRLGDSAGPIALDSSTSVSPGDYSGGVSLGQSGALVGVKDSAATFDGNSGLLASHGSYVNPTTYSLEAWFNTTTASGGKLVGFGDKATGLSGNYDRHVYMQNDGRLVFGTYTGVTNVITTPAAYNDGKWHSVVATQSVDGMVLYVDGQQVGTNPQTGAQNYTGYWRIGGDTTWGSTSPYFAGTLDEVAVYPAALTAAQVSRHYQLATSLVTPNQVPEASFTSAVKDLGVTVDGSGSSDPDGTIASYAWDFGDGATADGATASHAYAAAGTFTVTLTVTDNAGATGVKSVPVTVVTPNQVPEASFTSAVKDLGVTVDGSGSSDPDGTIASYAWDFGDGATADGATASHTYAAAGTFTVTLTVTDNAGATGVKSVPVTVVTPNQVPEASFTSAVKDLGVTVDGSGSSDPDGTIASYAWDFGDGATADGATASHTYAAAGTFTVTLTVTDNAGATGTTATPVTVVQPPAGTVDEVVVPAKSDWSWRYETTAPATGWKEPGFDASAWKTGGGVLGFGSSGLATNVDVPPPTSGRPLAAYFLHNFTVASAAAVQRLSLQTVADDGVVVYVNGTEVGRSNMPTGNVTFNTYAVRAVNTTTATNAPVTIDVPVSLLKDGANTIAVETHINYHATRDMSFDLTGTATVSTGAPAPNQAPVAGFTNKANDLAVTLDGTSSSDPDGTVASYSWDYGDQTAGGTGAISNHSYAASGTYTVTLTVTDNQGATGVSAAPITVTAPAAPADVVLVPTKSPWSWRFDSTAPPAQWKDRGFDASTWKIGGGVLGFGGTGLGTNIDVAGSASSRPLAAYFVGQFNLASASKVSRLTLNTVADDGAVVYVNGSEVARTRMPTGTPTFGTYALSAINTANANAAPLVIDVPVSLLVDGINAIAVETHLNYRATRDLSFDLSAVATTR